jgi:hypothetical protein
VLDAPNVGEAGRQEQSSRQKCDLHLVGMAGQWADESAGDRHYRSYTLRGEILACDPWVS